MSSSFAASTHFATPSAATRLERKCGSCSCRVVRVRARCRAPTSSRSGWVEEATRPRLLQSAHGGRLRVYLHKRVVNLRVKLSAGPAHASWRPSVVGSAAGRGNSHDLRCGAGRPSVPRTRSASHRDVPSRHRGREQHRSHGVAPDPRRSRRPASRAPCICARRACWVTSPCPRPRPTSISPMPTRIPSGCARAGIRLCHRPVGDRGGSLSRRFDA